MEWNYVYFQSGILKFSPENLGLRIALVSYGELLKYFNLKYFKMVCICGFLMTATDMLPNYILILWFVV